MRPNISALSLLINNRRSGVVVNQGALQNAMMNALREKINEEYQESNEQKLSYWEKIQMLKEKKKKEKSTSNLSIAMQKKILE